METALNEIPITETGSLGVLHLKRLWGKRMHLLQNSMKQNKKPSEENLDAIVLDGLGLGIVEPDLFLFQNQPSYEEFEQWILNTLAGNFKTETVDRVNKAIRNYLDCPHNEYPLKASISDPVLSEADMAFWDENGYVIVRQAIPKEDARAAELVVWDFLGKDPANPESWYGGEHTFWVPLFQHPAFIKNRQSWRIHKAFAQLWGTDDLLSTVDRASLNLPLQKDDMNLSGPSKLHWDASIAQPMVFRLQGILYLTDTAAEQGAFHCVPGFHHEISNWMESLSADADPRVEVTALVNRGSYPRVAQYMQMYPPDYASNPVWK